MPSEVPLEIDCQSVCKHLRDEPGFVLVDCREENEATIARIAGARLVPMSQIAARIAELEPLRAKQLVVHCHHGGRSLRVARWLREQGFARAQSMAGGIDEWAEKIDPTIARY